MQLDKNKNMSKTGIIFLIIIVFSLVGGIIWLKFEENSEKEKIETTQAILESIVIKDYVTGEIVYSKEVFIKPQISGILKKLYVEEGEYIEQGEKIALIEIVANPSTVEISDNNIKIAKVTYDREHKNYLRQKTLFEEGVIAKQEFERAEASFNLAEQELQTTKEQYFIAKKGYSNKTQTSNLVFSTTKGKIIDLPLEEGASIVERNNFNEGSTIAVIGSSEEVMFNGLINEKDLFNITEGKEIEISLKALPQKKLKGIIHSISEKAVDKKGVKKFDFKASIIVNDSLKKYIRSGLSAKAELILINKRDVLVIDERNIFYDKDSIYVEILDENQEKTKKVIEIGISDGKKTEIIKGISRGEKIIVQ